MKKIFTLLTIAAMAFVSANAQMKKNDLLIGGVLSFYKIDSKIETQEKDVLQGWTVAPSLGVFYSHNKMYGINLYYNHGSDKFPKKSSNTFGAGFFLRQYKGLGKNWLLFLEESINAQGGQSKDSNYVGYADVTKSFQVYLSVYPGIAYGITNRLMLELSLDNLVSALYQHQKTNYGDPTASNKTNNQFQISTGLSSSSLGYLGFGLKWQITPTSQLRN